MAKVFVEYKLDPRFREQYESWSRQVIEWTQSVQFQNVQFQSVQFYEGTDQPNLFVEIWDGMSHEQFLEFKDRRLSERFPDKQQAEARLFREMNDWVEGGAAKLHIWHFGRLGKEED
jgi:hypothetical protein